jgi:5'-deoxynucleotidase YfbR-like HD superfamily hydrolase
MNIIDKIFHDPDFDQLNNMVRWNGLNRIKDETVAHHSFFVAMVTRLLSEEIFDKNDCQNKLFATTYGMFHDFDEMFTGDIVHGVKYGTKHGEELRYLLELIVKEKVAEKFDTSRNSEKLMSDIMSLEIPYHIKKLVKVADWLSMLFYLKKELSLGNTALVEQQIYCVQRVKESCIDAMPYLKNYNTTILIEIIDKQKWI